MADVLRLKTHVVATSDPNDKPLYMSFLDSSWFCSKNICGEISSLYKMTYLQDVLHTSAGDSVENQLRELLVFPVFGACLEKVPFT